MNTKRRRMNAGQGITDVSKQTSNLRWLKARVSIIILSNGRAVISQEQLKR